MFAQDDLIMVLIDQALPFRGQLLDQGPFATDPSLASLFVFFSVFGSQGALTTFAFRLGASRRGVTRKEILYLNAWGLSRTFFKKFKKFFGECFSLPSPASSLAKCAHFRKRGLIILVVFTTDCKNYFSPN